MNTSGDLLFIYERKRDIKIVDFIIIYERKRDIIFIERSEMVLKIYERSENIFTEGVRGRNIISPPHFFIEADRLPPTRENIKVSVAEGWRFVTDERIGKIYERSENIFREGVWGRNIISPP